MMKDDLLLACLQGRIAPATAIARLLLAGHDPAAIRRRIKAMRAPGPAWAELRHLTRHRLDLEPLRRMLDVSAVDHAKASSPAAIAAAFDRAVAICPEASVAIYSLGDPTRLQAATDEIVEWLRREHLLAHDLDVLDLGCGIGRVAAAIAPRVGFVTCCDISHGMLRQAWIRCAALTNLSFVATSGQDLAAFGDQKFDLVIAVDSFPYLVQAGVAELHVAEVQRVLRPGGPLVLVNLSYRDDPEEDRADAEAWAGRYGFRLLANRVSPFQTWDGRGYILVKLPG
jgi:SAM-dependent methyltransferase